MAQNGLYKQGLWFYGVIIGLAIKESLVDVFPHLISFQQSDTRVIWFESVRLLVFLALSIRFYLGSVIFFEKAYGRPDSDKVYRRKSFGLDFLFGFLHFLLFFALAMSIDLDKNRKHWFSVFVGAILLYDVPWLIASRNLSTRHLIKMWTAINSLTFVLAAATYSVIRSWQEDALWAELCAYFWIMLANAIDMAEMITEKEIIKDRLQKFITRPDQSGSMEPIKEVPPRD